MSVVRIVHWRNIVGKDFLRQFEDIEKSAKEKRAVGLETETIAKDIRKAAGPEIYEEWQAKRAQMHFCGFEECADGMIRPTGWFDPVFKGHDLKFRFKAKETNPERLSVEYISLDSFRADRDTYRADEDGPQKRTYGLVKSAVAGIGTRAGKLDDDFTEEEAWGQ